MPNPQTTSLTWHDALAILGTLAAWTIGACMALTVPAAVYVASGWRGVAVLSVACGLVGLVGLAMAGER